MSKFYLKTSLFASFFIAIHLFASLRADRNIDPYYWSFAASGHNSLVLGSSLARHGIAPTVLDSYLHVDSYNFAFDLSTSPYGEYYFNSVKRKVQSMGTTELFIVEVSPWLLASYKNDTVHEEEGVLSNQYSYGVKPNLEYLIKNYEFGWGNFLLNWRRTDVAGAFQISDKGQIIRKVISPKEIEKKTEIKLRQLKERASELEISSTRMMYLRKLTKFLSNKGKVIYVSMPRSEPVLELEKECFGSFDEEVVKISESFDLKYYDYSGLKYSEKFQFQDGFHMTYQSSLKFSEILAQAIAEI